MSFTINQFDESLGEFRAVEMGLSLGEVRQSILDRIREDLHWEEENGLDWRTRVLHHATEIMLLMGLTGLLTICSTV